MKTSELLKENYEKITDTMKEYYRSVLESSGKIQYKLYIWDDGELATLEGAQGDNSWLQPKQYDTMDLHYICKIDFPCFDPWDYADHSAPEDDASREAEEAEIIDWLVDEYDPDEVLDDAIKDAERDEKF